MAFQRRPDPPITIGQILELAPGDKDNKQWVNGVLTCGICDVKPNKIGFSATLFDPDNTNVALVAKFFGSGIDRLEGQVITLSGGGMSWGEYKGASELAVGQKTRIECEGQAQPAFQAPPAARPAPYSAPQGATRVVGTPLPPAGRPAAPAGLPAGRSTSEDIALGRSSNNAIALLAKFGADKPIDWLDSDDFRMRLYVLTSDLLNVEKAVANKPAPTSKQRAGGMSVRQPAAPVAEVEEEQAPAPAPAPAPVNPVSRGVPGPSGAAYQPAAPATAGEVEDEIPFN